MSFGDVQDVVLAGDGDMSSVRVFYLNNHRADTDMTLSMSGLAGGFYAEKLRKDYGDIIIDASQTSGSFGVERMSTSDFLHSPSSNIILSTGTSGNFSANLINVAGDFILDATAHKFGAGDFY